MTCMLEFMSELLQSAHERHCRIKLWKLNLIEAIDLSLEISSVTGREPNAIYELMVRGDASIMGARIGVRPT